MSALDQQVCKTRRRLTVNVLLVHLARGVLAAAILWIVVVLVERVFGLGIALRAAGIVIGGVGLAVTAAGLYRDRISPLRAAVVLDEAAGLKERISTAITCRDDADPFARATVQDAERQAARVHVPAHVRCRAPDLWPWSLAAVIAGAIIFQFMPQLDVLAGDQTAAPDQTVQRQQARQIETVLNQRMEKLRRRVANTPGLADLQDDLKELKLPDEPLMTPEDIRREAVKRIDKVADKLKQRLNDDALESLERLKRDLAKLETPQGKDPAAKLAQALASGDMQAAKAAMEQLRKSLEQAADKSDDPETKRKLEQMRKKLDNLSKQLSKLGEDKDSLKDLQNKGGLSEKQAKELMKKLAGKNAQQIARQLQKQLAQSGMTRKQIQQLARKIAQNQQVRQQLKQLARNMAQAAQACQQCQQGRQGSKQPGNSGAGLQQAMQQLSQLEMAQQMADELRARLAELDQMKKGACQGNGNCPDPTDPNRIGGQSNQYGRGYGSRIGQKRSPHQYKTQIENTRIGQGQIIGEQLFDGPQIRGRATAEARPAIEAAVRDAEDAVEREQIPRQYEQIVRTYFERLAGLMAGGGPRSKEKASDAPAAEAPEGKAGKQDD